MNDSLAMHKLAMTLFEDLASEVPTDAELRGEVVRSCLAVALNLASVGQKAEALASSARGRAIAQSLVDADPADPGRRSELARIEHLHGDVLFENSRRRGAAVLERARAIQEDLSRTTPTVDRFRYELSATCDTLAMHLTEAGRWDEALAAYDRARDLGEVLFRASPTDARIAHELVRTLGNMAIALESTGRRAGGARGLRPGASRA